MTQSPLDQYRRILSDIRQLDNQAFHDALTQSRDGDEAAVRAISGSCLKHAFEVAESWISEHSDKNSLDVVQEANTGLVEAIRRFTGSNLDDFLAFARETILEYLDSAFEPE